MFKIRKNKKGQSLVELLVAAGVGVVLIGSTVALLVSILRMNQDANKIQVGVSLSKELLGKVNSFAKSNWYNIYNLNKGSNYYLLGTSTFTATSGTESLTVASTTYSRAFSVSNVNRDASGFITSGAGNDDPSTQQINVVYSWPYSATFTISTYLTRYDNQVTLQNDWSGGPGQNGPLVVPNNLFSSSTNIDYRTTTGQIIIQTL